LPGAIWFALVLTALTPHNQPYTRSSSVTVRHRWAGADSSLASLRVDASVVAVLCANVKPAAGFGPALALQPLHLARSIAKQMMISASLSIANLSRSDFIIADAVVAPPLRLGVG
jgi:hypothetical protein